MTARAGGLVDGGVAYFDLSDRRRGGELYRPTESFYFDLPDRRRGGEAVQNTQGGTIVYYKMRARDSGLGPPPVYRIWVTTDPTADPPPPAAVGSWVDKTILT